MSTDLARIQLKQMKDIKASVDTVEADLGTSVQKEAAGVKREQLFSKSLKRCLSVNLAK